MSKSLVSKIINVVVEYNRSTHKIETDVEALTALVCQLLPKSKPKPATHPRDPYAPKQFRGKLSKEEREEYEKELAEYSSSERCALWTAYCTRLASNKALVGDGVHSPDPNAPAKRRSALEFYYEAHKSNTKYFKSKWVSGAKDKLKEKFEALNAEKMEKYEDAEFADDVRYLREYAQYIPSDAYLAKVASLRAVDAPKKPKSINVMFVDEYVAKNAKPGDDKETLKELKATAKALYAKLSKDDKAVLSAKRDTEMGVWKTACTEYAKSHPTWICPVSPKVEKAKGAKKGSPSSAKKTVPVPVDSDEEEDAEAVASDEEEDASEEESD
jgi:hypothetical protein